MKKHNIIITLALILSSVFFLSCNKSDMRDRFVGLYNMNVDGILYMSEPNGANRVIVWEFPNQRLSIAKQPGVSNGVVVKGYYECDATIDNSYIYGEPFTLIDTITGIPMTLNLVPSKGYLNGNDVLTFEVTATGEAYYEETTCKIEGTSRNTARKL